MAGAEVATIAFMRLGIGVLAAAIVAVAAFVAVLRLDGDDLTVDPETGLVNGLDQFDHVAYWNVANQIEGEAELLVKECMEAKGLRYDDHEATIGPPPEARRADAETFAAEFGFGVTPIHVLPAVPRPKHPLADEVAAEYVRDEGNYESAYGGSFFNPFDGGCRGHGYERFDDTVGPGNRRWEDLTLAMHAFLDDAAIEQHFAEWRECMTAAGYEYRSPWHAREFFADEVVAIERAGRPAGVGAFDELVSLERDTATASNDCGVSPRLGLPQELVSVWVGHAEQQL